MQCSFYWDKYHSNYNICPLELDSTSQNQFYVVNDARYNNAPETVKYYFNLGSPVIDYPSDSCAAAINAPLARWLAFRNNPPDPWWIAVIAASSNGLCFIPTIFR